MIPPWWTNQRRGRSAPMGIALSVLEIKRIKTVNMLPSLVIAGMLAFFL